MPCDTKLRAGQTITERKSEILDVIAAVQAALVSGNVKAKVGPQGAIAFEGLSDATRNNVTDACIYRRIMATGSALAKAQIAKAEQMSGRSVSRTVVNGGTHSHDGGKTWHGHD